MKPPELTAADFPQFFQELWGFEPFPWQTDFARHLCDGTIPDYVSVPTGSGKTACLDAAVFALAAQASLPAAERSQGRRVFFIVNRRVIVDEAFERAGRICKSLREAASDTMLRRVANALLSISGESTPLKRVQLRGGIYRDRSWAGSLLQPMIICSTVDQAGSRLLFRGYGVGPQAQPIHAALVAQDSLLIIDEAHISRPFIQTLDWVRQYRLYQPTNCEPICLPFQFVQLTATPPNTDSLRISLSAADHKHPILRPRLARTKPASLVVEPKAKGKACEEHLAKRLVAEAETILSQNRPRSLAIMVNRVATARLVEESLRKKLGDRVMLLIGRMRPLDKDAITEKIQNVLKTGAADDSKAEPLLVVSTQCLEVGADLDFDALVTEAASLDALRQRFGRLNRGGRDLAARAVVVLPGDQDIAVSKLENEVPCDPIYGNAIPHTWDWLTTLAQAGAVDFGIGAMTAEVETVRVKDIEKFEAMLSPTKDAPVLLPAYLDCWVQTSPQPAADPDVALFLHGPQRDMAEVQVCWRGDLPENKNKAEWAEILSLCPPNTAECLSVPLHVFRDWLNSKGMFVDRSADVSQIESLPEKKGLAEMRPEVAALVWRDPKETFFINRPSDVRPGDTVVLRVQNGGWNALGHLPNAPEDPETIFGKVLSPQEVRRVDVAETAAALTRRRAVRRIHPALWRISDEGPSVTALWDANRNSEKDWSADDLKSLLAFARDEDEVTQHLATKGIRLRIELYPNRQGLALSSPDLLPVKDPDAPLETDTDSEALLESTEPQELWMHTKDVLAQVEKAVSQLSLPAWRQALVAAAAVHDWGKCDVRFQALLRGSTPFAAMASTVLLAKSRSISGSAAARRAARQQAEIPEGFRHELLSVQMAQAPAAADALPSDPNLRTLALHLVATHHGYARPFAPFVEDQTPFEASLPMDGKTIALSASERLKHPQHALDSGLAERFWQMNRRYGWWNIAFLEAVLRLADQYASANLQTNGT